MKIGYFLVLSLFCSFTLRAQGEFNNWYFGLNAGVSFATGSPVAITNGALSTYEGSASISDAAGSLLFYTDGVTVWDKTHTAMPNGTGLFGNPSSAQSAIIVPWPGSASKYFVFTVDAEGGTDGLCYSVVDMSLNGSNGNVTTKNVQLYTPSRESLTAVKHRNGCDIWVLSHKWNSDEFYTYKVTSAGVNTTPVITAIGRVSGGPIVNSAIGYMKANRQATKLALGEVVNPAGTSMELFDFNNSTGVVSNAMILNTGFSQTYGCEFSPNGNLLYGSSGSVYQFDVTLATLALINASKVVVGSGTFGALQVGPDNKMYQVTTNSFLNVINNPNTAGTGCNFVTNAVPLGGKNGFLGLPNFITSWVAKSPGNIEVRDTCEGDQTTFFLSDTSSVLALEWDLGDPGSGSNNTSNNFIVQHDYPGTGIYTVTLILHHTCKTDTIYRPIHIVPGFDIDITSSGSAGCSGQSNAILTVNQMNGTAPFLYSWSQGSTENPLNHVPVGSHSVVVTDDNGCKKEGEKTIVSDEEYSLFAENTFTPNADNVNDVFLPVGNCIETYELFIFDRWGNKIFKSNSSSKGWDGKRDNTLSQQDTYVWRLVTHDSFGNEHKYFGHVNLLR